MTTLTLKQIDAKIKSIKTNYVKVREQVQIAAIAIITHASEYGDCTRAVKLIRAIPARERNSLIGYFSLYSPIGVQLGKTAIDDKCRFIKETSKNYNIFNLEGARANMWYDDPANANPEPAPLKTLDDCYSNVSAIFERMTRSADDKFTPEAQQSVKAFIEHMKSEVSKYRANNETGDIDFGQNDTVVGGIPAQMLQQVA